MKFIFLIILPFFIFTSSIIKAQVEATGSARVSISIISKEAPKIYFSRESLVLELETDLGRSYIVNYFNKAQISSIKNSIQNINSFEINDKFYIPKKQMKQFPEPSITIAY